MSTPNFAPFIQLVSFCANNADDKKKLQSLWSPGVSYVKSIEQGKVTTTYDLFNPEPLDGPQTQPEVDGEIVALESYTSKAEYDAVHMQSGEINTFLKQVTDQKVLKRETQVTALIPTGIGFHSRGASVESANPRSFTLLVDIVFRDPVSLQRSLLPFSTLSRYVESSEPDTLSYEGFFDAANPRRLIIFERYTNKEALTDVHWKSEAFATFGGQLKSLDLVETKTARTYLQTNQGFWGTR